MRVARQGEGQREAGTRTETEERRSTRAVTDSSEDEEQGDKKSIGYATNTGDNYDTIGTCCN